VELAGLEPATSWVRFAPDRSREFAIVRRWLNHALCGPTIFAVGREGLSPKIDQRLTTGYGPGAALGSESESQLRHLSVTRAAGESALAHQIS
jgi:hypothetical protein